MFIEVTTVFGKGEPNKVLLNVNHINEVWPRKGDRSRVKMTGGHELELLEPYQDIRDLIYQEPPIFKPVFS